MNKIAVFTDRDGKLCEFFDAERFMVFDRAKKGWEKIREASFEKVIPSVPAQTRQSTEALLPLIGGSCDILAGGTLVGIPFSVFDREGYHIFEISEINDGIFDGIMDDLRSADADAAAKEAIIRDAKPVETSTPGVYYLDLIALQKECREVSSKKAMMGFLKDTPFLELRLVCKHIPPWIENSGAYNVQTVSDDGGTVTAVITRKC
ncbi:MAG: hypothetical protein LBH93_00920 [Chitinispirillales bacterium]|jgi:hypothetical protein|nr:hypothetical protein [Chitinispirillales bacterium]